MRALRLRHEYPEWTIAVTQEHCGDRPAAYRSAGAGTLVALITADPAELRRELDAAAASRMSVRTGRASSPATG